MLNWIRDNFLRRSSVNRASDRLLDETGNSSKLSKIEISNNMLAEQTATQNVFEKVILHVNYEGEIWIVNADKQQVLSEFMVMVVTHFFDPKDSHKFASKYKLITILPYKVLNLLFTIGDEELKNNDEILLTRSISTGASVPLKLSLQDIKGPSKEEVMLATLHLPKKNPVKTIPALDCQENFQSEIRKVLYSLVEASAKILSQSSDAKVVFDGIATRISAKNKKVIDKSAVKYLKDLGFTEVQARYALRLKRNRQVEAMEWLLENSHRVKEDTVESVEDVSTSSEVKGSDDPLQTINRLLLDIREFHQRHFEPNAKALEILTAMGFTPEEAVEALRLTGNNQLAACEWLCGERDPSLAQSDPGLDTDGPLYKALMSNPAVQLGLHNPKIMLAFLSILENPSSANLWLNDVDTAPVLGQVFKTYHSEKHIMVVNQQMELLQRHNQP